MVVPPKIAELIKKFDNNSAAFRNKDYNELTLRTDFINPFFEELGWDVIYNQSEDIRERAVLLENFIPIKGPKKRMDYEFRMGSRTLFVVETKKPSVGLEKNPETAHQIRTYVYNANASLGILTNFQEFAIYKRVKPSPDADPDYGLLCEPFTYKDLPEKWDWIEKTFGRENAYKEIDQYLAIKQGKKKLISIDDDILSEIEGWREVLARNIALRNREQKLNVDELNAVVQRTIDRILFFRICEDRGIEAENTLYHLIESDHIYDKLRELFRDADIKYNSGLFHFRAEADWNESPDILSEHVVLDDKILKEIIRDLYEPRSCYRWDIISPAILGQVYEQFLGKVIRLTDGGQAKIEFKPEVKKAGGVFYTPEFIVDYIVKHTVGELVNGKTPREVSSLRILDPACGSGSFLIGAYQYLLDWHLEWYRKNLVPVYLEKGSHSDPGVIALLPEPLPKKKVKGSSNEDKFPLYRLHSASPETGAPENWKLKTTEKKRILLNNIYGVDIDQQAVEVTKLSLMLKVLEEENSQNISKQLKLFAEPALPRLDQNIKCGNSLIGTDIRTPDMPQEDVSRINPFDWEREFSVVMKAGGFDAVIGNPPYIRIQRIDYNQVDYLYKKYSTPTSKTDISIVFIEKAAALIKKSGIVGLICSSQWMSTDYGKNIRRFLSDGKLLEIVNFGSLPVFQKASTYPAIFILNHNLTKHVRLKKITSSNQLSLNGIESEKALIIPIETLSENPWNFGAINIETILNSRGIDWKNFSHYGQAFIGVLTGMDNAFIVDKKTIDENKLETQILYPYAYQGAEVFRYCQVSPSEYMIYPYNESKDGIPRLIDEKNLKIKYPNIYQYLSKFKNDLQKRLDSRKLYAQGEEWFRQLRPGSFNYIRPKKFIIKGIDKFSKVGLLDVNSAFNGANCPGIILNEDQNNSTLFFLGLLNSKVLSFHLRMVCPPKLSGYCRFNSTNVNQLPIRTINFSNPVDKDHHDRMVTLVTQMLNLNKKMQDVRLEHDKVLLQRQIEITDEAIDKLVYELYGLTPEEITIVEGKTTTPLK